MIQKHPHEVLVKFYDEWATGTDGNRLDGPNWERRRIAWHRYCDARDSKPIGTTEHEFLNRRRPKTYTGAVNALPEVFN